MQPARSLVAAPDSPGRRGAGTLAAARSAAGRGGGPAPAGAGHPAGSGGPGRSGCRPGPWARGGVTGSAGAPWVAAALRCGTGTRHRGGGAGACRSASSDRDSRRRRPGDAPPGRIIGPVTVTVTVVLSGQVAEPGRPVRAGFRVGPAALPLPPGPHGFTPGQPATRARTQLAARAGPPRSESRVHGNGTGLGRAGPGQLPVRGAAHLEGCATMIS